MPLLDEKYLNVLGVYDLALFVLKVNLFTYLLRVNKVQIYLKNLRF